MGRVTRVEVGDPRLAPYVGMYAADERGDDLCIIESRLAVEALLDSPYEPVSLLISERLEASLGSLIEQFAADVLIAPQPVINDTVGFNMHRGVVACARRGSPLDAAALVRDASLVVALEGVSDPENLGAIFRNAAAFGVDAIVMDPTTCDALSRRTIRVSMGHALRVPFARGSFDVLDAFTTVALTPDGDVSIRDVAAARVALFVGNEGNGLSAELMAQCDVRAVIPMAKGVDSLNAATAAAVALAFVTTEPTRRR